MSARSSYDAVVIGGGPAGSAAALTLAHKGRRPLVVERLEFPRFRIGESLLPGSNPLFSELGLSDRLAAAGFVEKRGATFCAEDGEIGGEVDFSLASDLDDPVTYQVPRERFDEILLEAVREANVEIRQPCRAHGFRRRSADELEVELEADGARTTVSCHFVLDCSGQSGFLAKRLDLRRRDAELRSVALHARFRGVERLPPPRDGDIRIVSLGDMGWIWLIPLEDHVTSVGLVLPTEVDRELGPGRDVEALAAHLKGVPALAQVMRRAEPLGALRRDADFSYSAHRYCGDGWLLAGDAGSFLDPIFSTGVLIALESGREAALAVDRALGEGTSRAAMAAYERRQRRRYNFYRRFSTAFYDPAFRDVFLQPTDRFGLRRSVTTALAGVWRLRLLDRLRLLVFFALVALQRRLSIVPRAHRQGAGSEPAPAKIPD